jgi:uncharacterized membrane protein
MRRAGLIGLFVLAGCSDNVPDKPLAGIEASVTPATAPPSDTSFAPVAVESSSSANSESAIGFAEKHFQALGTEPFWSIEVLSGKLLYTSPDNQVGVAITSRLTSEGKRLHYSGTMDGKAVSLLIESGECSDGMSDTVYAHKATFTWGERTEQGCARLK